MIRNLAIVLCSLWRGLRNLVRHGNVWGDPGRGSRR